ncbi:hypothetical protein GBA52_015879 [Prunus armeniaca]|nr:hypothetical protein GBA52_015879 [Prunus armeniaca]
MSQGDVLRHGGAEGDTKLACLQGDVLGTGVLKAKGMPKGHKACMSQGDGPRHEGAECDTKLACRKAMGLGTRVPNATQSLRVARRCA